MDSKDRERLMLSTGIALVGYAVIFLLLMGLKWPPVVPFRAINPPVSVYVNLQGSALTEVTAAQPAQPAAPPAQSKTSVAASSKPKAASTETPAPKAQAASPQASASEQQTQPPAPVASQATAIPGRPNIPSSITSSAGPSASGASSAQAGTAGGAPQSGGAVPGQASATPGVNYPQTSQSSSAPPAGSGGTGTQQDQGQSQTYYGSPGSSSGGSIFNPDLAAKAGTSSGSAGPQSSSSSSGQTGGASGSTSSGTASAGSAGGAGTGTGTGSASSSASGPRINWNSTSPARKVRYQPPKLVIPPRYLGEIPPSIELKITFQVSPLGIVNALNVNPSLGYPELDNMVKRWMDEWQFEPVRGNQLAQGTLQYVIQATTAR